MVTVKTAYFDSPTASLEAYPLLRMMAERKKDGLEPKVEILRPHDVFGYKPAKIYLHFFDPAGKEPVPYQTEDWDDELNAALIAHGVKAIRKENEVLRFSLVLRAALRGTVNRFGEGFYNSVLVDSIQTGPFNSEHAVTAVLKDIARYEPNRESPDYSYCRERIENAIRGRAYELNHNLHYPPDDAASILTGVVALYLDDRFSVTTRKLLGLK